MINVTFAVMGSQKTAQMMMQIHHLRAQGHHVLVAKPARDTRDGAYLASRAPIAPIPCVTFGATTTPIETALRLAYYASEVDAKHLFIDEVNFMTVDEVNYAAMFADKYEMDLHFAGLLTDFREEMFPGSKRALELCDTFHTIKTPCQCGRDATRNMRLLDGRATFTGEQIQVGGDESYRSVCRKCYNNKKAAQHMTQVLNAEKAVKK